MRKLTELQDLAAQHGISTEHPAGGLKTREDLMDDLRAKIGTFDPDLQIDPMKAKDLKNLIKWGTEGQFAGIAKFLNSDHVLEPKLDGARIRLFLGQEANTLNTGRRSDVTYSYIERADNFPHLRDCPAPELAGTILDAEVMMPAGTSIDLGKGDHTKGPLNTIMAVLNINPAMAVARQEKYGKATLHCFDILAVKGESTLHLPLSERRSLLEKVVALLGCEHIVALEQVEASVENIERYLDLGFEGGMIKRLASRYVPGGRTSDWMKVKRMSTGDFFIIGSNAGKGKNEGKVGSLKVAYMDEAGKPVYCADVRGFDDATMDWLTNSETGEVKTEHIGTVIEIMGQGRTKNERIRHPHLVRFRPDKTAVDCGRDQLELFSEV